MWKSPQKIRWFLGKIIYKWRGIQTHVDLLEGKVEDFFTPHRSLDNSVAVYFHHDAQILDLETASQTLQIDEDLHRLRFSRRDTNQQKWNEFLGTGFKENWKKTFLATIQIVFRHGWGTTWRNCDLCDRIYTPAKNHTGFMVITFSRSRLVNPPSSPFLLVHFPKNRLKKFKFKWRISLNSILSWGWMAPCRC